MSMISIISKSSQPLKPHPLVLSLLSHLFSTSTLSPAINIPGVKAPDSLTVTFLTKSCKLPLDSALLASKKIKLDSLEKPKSLLKYLRSIGIKSKQIEGLISFRPGILCTDYEETLKPSVDIFRSVGISGPKLNEMVKKEPATLFARVSEFLDLLRSYGLTDDQVKGMILKRPSVILLDADKNLRLKLEFLRGLGISDSIIATTLVMKPYFMERSLEKHIKPSIEVLKGLFGSNENMLKSILGFSRVLEMNFKPLLKPNVSVLRSRGVPESNILKCFIFEPCPLLLGTDRLVQAADKAKEMGFNPQLMLYILAVRALGGTTDLLWEQKAEAYASFGLSGDLLITAFKRQPMIMSISVKKINAMMHFFVNRLKMKPEAVAKDPSLMLLSLEKRLIPWSSVLEVLVSKKIVSPMTPSYVLKMNQKTFHQRFVAKLKLEAPDIVRASQGKLDFEEFTWTESYKKLMKH